MTKRQHFTMLEETLLMCIAELISTGDTGAVGESYIMDGADRIEDRGRNFLEGIVEAKTVMWPNRKGLKNFIKYHKDCALGLEEYKDYKNGLGEAYRAHQRSVELLETLDKVLKTNEELD